MKHGTLSLSAVLVAAAALIFTPSCHRKNDNAVEQPRDTVYPLGFCTDSFDLAEGTLKNGEIFTGLMTRLGMTPQAAMALVSASDSVFDPRKMRAGSPWQAYYSLKDSTEQVLEYDLASNRVQSAGDDHAHWQSMAARLLLVGGLCLAGEDARAFSVATNALVELDSSDCTEGNDVVV